MRGASRYTHCGYRVSFNKSVFGMSLRGLRVESQRGMLIVDPVIIPRSIYIYNILYISKRLSYL